MSVTREPAPLNWRLLLWWVLATAIGFSVGGPIEAVLGRSSGILVIVYVSAGGTAAAVLQWLALRRHVSQAGWWVGTGIVGGVVAGAVGVAVGVSAGVTTGVIEGLADGAAKGMEAGIDAGVDAAGVTMAVVFGAAVGVVQWLMLRLHVAGAGWWVLASGVGWVVSGFAAGVTDTAAGWAVLGAVYGAITGSVLVWLLRQRLGAG
ncbi:MAG: hypothetical protein F4045_07580 [Chloroflexi bacterium]|nr:hypothetical protein [Chloroflexota bacterium]MYK34956.1 hypothetical protein [Chloroflexota bacterium]